MKGQKHPPTVACVVLSDEAAAHYSLPPAGRVVQLEPPAVRHLVEAGAVKIVPKRKASR